LLSGRGWRYFSIEAAVLIVNRKSFEIIKWLNAVKLLIDQNLGIDDHSVVPFARV